MQSFSRPIERIPDEPDVDQPVDWSGSKPAHPQTNV